MTFHCIIGNKYFMTWAPMMKIGCNSPWKWSLPLVKVCSFALKWMFFAQLLKVKTWKYQVM